MILRIDGYSARRSLDPGDVDLAHGHHGFEGALGRGLVGIAVGPQQRTRRDLPRKAPPILAPAAGAFLPAIADDGVPVTVGLVLVVGQDHEADRLIGLEVGSAVQADEGAAEHGELDREFGALCPTRKVGRGVHGRADPAVGKGCGVELRSLAGFPLIEPQAGRELVAGHDISPRLRWPTNPKTAPWGSTAVSAYSPPGSSLGP